MRSLLLGAVANALVLAALWRRAHGRDRAYAAVSALLWLAVVALLLARGAWGAP